MSQSHILLVIASALLVAPAFPVTTANAATTHKGMPKALLGKFKRHTKFQTIKGKTYEYARLYWGKKHGFASGSTYADTYYSHVRYYKSLGHKTYKLYYNEPITGKHQTIYVRRFNANKVGLKATVHGHYYTYNSRKPVLNYNYNWIG